MDAGLTRETLVRRSNRVRAAFAGRDLVLLDLDRGTYFSLNPTGAWIWDRIQRGETLGVLSSAMARHFGIDPAAAWSDLLEISSALIEEGLVAIVREIPSRG